MMDGHQMEDNKSLQTERKIDKKILSALIGLTGAIGNNSKTENTDKIVKAAILATDPEGWVEKLHNEKYAISPNCKTCKSPCGNTSDYELEKIDQWTSSQRQLKEQVMVELQKIAAKIDEGNELPDIIYRAISYMGYDLQEETYLKLLEEMREW